MRLVKESKALPKEEIYSLTDQVRRSSRSVTVNPTEARRKRRHPAAFVSKLSDAEAEAAETQEWVVYAVKRGYLSRPVGAELFKEYDAVLKTLVGMIKHADAWVMRPRGSGEVDATPHSTLSHSTRRTLRANSQGAAQ
jgi:four helix bundle protein